MSISMIKKSVKASCWFLKFLNFRENDSILILATCKERNSLIFLKFFFLFENFGAKILIAQILKEYSNSIYSEPEFLTYGIPYEQYKETGYCLGVLDFLNYKKALITEKDIFGYKNLVIACEIEKELSKKK